MPDYFYLSRYWAYYNCLLIKLDVIKFEINPIFLIKLLCYMTKKSRTKPKYLENKNSFWVEIKSIFHHFQRAFNRQNLPQTWECALKSCLKLFWKNIHQFLFLTWIHELNLSFSAGFNYWLNDYFQLVSMEWKFPLGLFKPWSNFSSIYCNKISACNCNSIFMLLSLTIPDEISSRFNN